MTVRLRAGLIIPLYVMWIFHPVTTGQKANIIIPPRAVNVSINAMAEFTCTAVGNTITWKVDGQQIDEGERVVIITVVVNDTLSIRMSTLKLTASSTNNATNITCFAASFSPDVTFAESRPVLLLVQGPPGAVNDLTVVFINSTTVLISWCPPFTLEGIPILGYNVTITNTTSGENEIMSVEGDTTMLYYSIDHPDPDNNFTVTVVPINGVEVASKIFIILTEIVHSKLFKPSATSILNILESINFKPLLLSATILVTEQPSAYTNTITIEPSVGIPDSSDNLTVSALISVNVITVVTVLSIVAAIVGCFFIRKYIKTRVDKAPLEDVVPVSDNPAYQMVIVQRSVETPQLKETATITIRSTACTSPQYENIPEDDTKNKDNNNSCDEGDYENVE